MTEHKSFQIILIKNDDLDWVEIMHLIILYANDFFVLFSLKYIIEFIFFCDFFVRIP